MKFHRLVPDAIAGRSPVRRAALMVALAAALAVAGCSLTRPAPVKQTYLLDPPPPPAVAKAQPTSMRVGVVNVAVPFRGRSFVSREPDLRYETDFYSEFLVPPPTMLTELTARAIEQSHAFARVVPAGAIGSADWTLDGFASALYADARDGKAFAAELAISYYLFAGDGGGIPVWTRDYQRRVPMTAPTSQAYAAALNIALGQIFADLARDLAAADFKPGSASTR